jgi:hypothetical protein
VGSSTTRPTTVPSSSSYSASRRRPARSGMRCSHVRPLIHR